MMGEPKHDDVSDRRTFRAVAAGVVLFVSNLMVVNVVAPPLAAESLIVRDEPKVLFGWPFALAIRRWQFTRSVHIGGSFLLLPSPRINDTPVTRTHMNCLALAANILLGILMAFMVGVGIDRVVRTCRHGGQALACAMLAIAAHWCPVILADSDVPTLEVVYRVAQAVVLVGLAFAFYGLFGLLEACRMHRDCKGAGAMGRPS